MITLTEKDYKELYPILAHDSELFIMETYFLYEQEDVSLSKMESEWEETKNEAKDSLVDGISRAFYLVDKIKKLINNKMIAVPVSYLISKVYSVYKDRQATELKQYEELISNKTKKLFSKYYKGEKYDPSNPEHRKMFAKLFGKIKVKFYEKTHGADDIRKLKLSNSLWNKFRGFIREKLLKMKSGRYTEKIIDNIDKLLTLSKKHPYLSVISIALIIGLLIFTVFKWNNVKRIFKIIVKILTAPFRYLYKGVKWILQKIFGKKKNTEQK